MTEYSLDTRLAKYALGAFSRLLETYEITYPDKTKNAITAVRPYDASGAQTTPSVNGYNARC